MYINNQQAKNVQKCSRNSFHKLPSMLGQTMANAPKHVSANSVHAVDKSVFICMELPFN